VRVAPIPAHKDICEEQDAVQFKEGSDPFYTSARLSPRGTTRYPLNRSLGEPQSLSGCSGEEKKKSFTLKYL
jgi:hypothetical protein